jgi:hypothetical protein
MMKRYLTLIFLVGVLQSQAQNASEHSGEVCHAYFDYALGVIPVTPGFTPPVVSRAMGYMGLTAYESVVHGSEGKQSFAGVLPELGTLPLPGDNQEYHWPTVANHALFQVASYLFSNVSEANDALLSSIKNDLDATNAAGVEPSVFQASVLYGQELGIEMAEFASLDGQDACQLSNFPVDYTPPAGDSLWVPQAGQTALQPYWGDKRCFVVDYVTLDMVPAMPVDYSEDPGSDFYNQAVSVYQASIDQTEEEETIARYWADGANTITPPGHSISMVRNILIHEAKDLSFSAEAYARVGMAVSDAFVQCWKTKYHYNLLRPITYIREQIDPAWTPLIGTPPFPEFTSGHSSQSSAFAAVMNELFGENYAFTDSTHGENFGGPRTFENFDECAQEAAVSRLYGGIHYPMGNETGIIQGGVIGGMVNDLFSLVVGVEEAVASSLGLFPNPAQTSVTIMTPLAQNAQYTMFNASGSLVMAGRANSTLDLSGLAPGLYILALSDESGNYIAKEKLIIQ